MDVIADSVTNLEVIRAEGDVLGAVAADVWDRDVPSCPGWDVGALLAHTGSIHRWVVATVAAGEPVSRRRLPGPPEDRDALAAWYAAGLDDLAVLTATDPETVVWTFAASGERRAGWWTRRMAQETSLHRWDAQSAAASGRPNNSACGRPGSSAPGRPDGFDPEVAVAGIDEYLFDFLPSVAADAREVLGGTLHLHTTDADGEWILDLDDLSTPARREHVKADTAVRGAASDLLLWLWNRQPGDGHLEAFGDAGLLECWTQIRI